MDSKSFAKRDKRFSKVAPLENPNLEMKIRQSAPLNSRKTAELFNIARQFAQLSRASRRRYVGGNKLIH